MGEDYKVIGSKVAYMLVQKREETGAELPIYFNQYNGSLNPSDRLEDGTRFDDVELVKQLCVAQNTVATILKQPYKYMVVKESIERVEELAE